MFGWLVAMQLFEVTLSPFGSADAPSNVERKTAGVCQGFYGLKWAPPNWDENSTGPRCKALPEVDGVSCSIQTVTANIFLSRVVYFILRAYSPLHYDDCLANDSHVLHNLLSDRNDYSYSLRPRCHDRVLPIRRDNRNFFDRHLFKDMN